MSIYVAAALLAAKKEVIIAIKRVEVERLLADSEWPVEEEPLRLCGFEGAPGRLQLEPEHLRQGVGGEVGCCPILELREAQSLMGGLVWLAIKTSMKFPKQMVDIGTGPARSASCGGASGAAMFVERLGDGWERLDSTCLQFPS